MKTVAFTIETAKRYHPDRLPIHDRLRLRWHNEGSLPHLTAAQVIALRRHFFRTKVRDVYLCHSGEILDGDKFRRFGRGCNFYVASLVSMQQYGIPCNIGRGHSQLNIPKTLEIA